MTQTKNLWDRLRKLTPWLVLAIIVFVIVGVILFRHAATPPTPGAFYTPPDPLPTGNPGTIIRSEPITYNLPKGAVAWRILYLSTDLNGKPIAVSGVVVAPDGESKSPRPVIAWAQGTQGIFPECGTSHMNNPFKFISGVDLMVREGFVVAATDYPGRGTPGIHPYLVGPVEAYSVLDSVRAARQLGVNAGDRYAIWGASQGGHATLWAAQSASTYAPELTLVGAAAQAAAIDLPGIFRSAMDKKIGGVLMAQALYSWSQVYPDAKLDNIIKPEMKAQFEKLARPCLTAPLAYLTIGNISTPPEFLKADPLTTEPWKTIINNNVPRGSIDVPILITHGTADPLIPIEGSIAEADRRCVEGENVTFMRFPGVEHPGSDDTAVATVGWIEDRFSGLPQDRRVEIVEK